MIPKRFQVIIENRLAQFPDGSNWSIEIKRSLSPKPEKGFYIAREDLQSKHSFVVYPGEESYYIKDDIEVISLESLSKKIINLA